MFESIASLLMPREHAFLAKVCLPFLPHIHLTGDFALRNENENWNSQKKTLETQNTNSVINIIGLGGVKSLK